jgi:hypothetical protein
LQKLYQKFLSQVDSPISVVIISVDYNILYFVSDIREMRRDTVHRRETA